MSFRDPISPRFRKYDDDKGWSPTTKLHHPRCRPYKSEGEYAVLDDDAIVILFAVAVGWPIKLDPTAINKAATKPAKVKPAKVKPAKVKPAPQAPHIVKRTGITLWRVLEIARALKGEYLLCLDDMPWCLTEDGLALLQQVWVTRQITLGRMELIDA